MNYIPSLNIYAEFNSYTLSLSEFLNLAFYFIIGDRNFIKKKKKQDMLSLRDPSLIYCWRTVIVVIIALIAVDNFQRKQIRHGASGCWIALRTNGVASVQPKRQSGGGLYGWITCEMALSTMRSDFVFLVLPHTFEITDKDKRTRRYRDGANVRGILHLVWFDLFEFNWMIGAEIRRHLNVFQLLLTLESFWEFGEIWQFFFHHLTYISSLL